MKKNTRKVAQTNKWSDHDGVSSYSCGDGGDGELKNMLISV